MWFRLRAEMRARWRATVSLGLLVALAGGFVLAAAAGARRTSTAYDRFLAEHAPAQVFLPNPAMGAEFGAVVHDPAEIEAMPQVAAMSVGRTAVSAHGAAFASADVRFGFEVPRWKILEGRAYDPARIDEAVAFLPYAERAGLSVGDRIRYPGEPPADEEVPRECARVGDGPQVEVTIVGIAVAPGPFFASTGDEPWSLALTPAMHDHLPSIVEATGCELLALPTPGMMWVQTHPGQTEDFLRALDREAGNRFVISEVQRVYDERHRDSIALQGTALWALAATAAFAVLLIVSQAVSRQIRIESEDASTLRALGLTRPQLAATLLMRVVAVGLLGAISAVLIAFGLSSLTPLGVARIAEPSPGLHFDAVTLSIGALVIIAALVVVAAPVAWLSARGLPERAPTRPSFWATVASRAGLPTPAVAGLRMAFEPGRGRAAVPVRSSISSIAVALAMVAATLTFGASASHLLATPEAYGLTIDAWVNNDMDPRGFPFRDHVDTVRAHPGIAGAALGTVGMTVLIDGKATQAIDFELIHGDVLPTVLRGRFPSAGDEILLGARTAANVGKGVGDRVTVNARTDDDEASVTQRVFTVAGIGEIPPMERSGLGEGAILTIQGSASLLPRPEMAGQGLFVKIAPDADRDETLASLKRAMGNRGLQHFGFPPPSDVVDFGRVRTLPSVLAGILALIAAASLGHVLVTAVRRRRRDLAILKTLGFYRGQARTAVAWQASATVVAALAIGVPLGVAAGRWSWQIFVDRLGLAPHPVVPLAMLALVVPVTLLLANVIALMPGRSAARTQPAIVLRAE